MELREVTLLYDVKETNLELERCRRWCGLFKSFKDDLSNDHRWWVYRTLWYHYALQETDRVLFDRKWESKLWQVDERVFDALKTISHEVMSRAYFTLALPHVFNDQEATELQVNNQDLLLRFPIGPNHVCYPPHQRYRTGFALRN